MKTTYNTVDDYINSYNEPLRNKLQELRKIILAAVPIGTTEIISYGMPTYKWNGTVIHFAPARKHLGIYPGSSAIIAFKESLTTYKTSKGAIQLPLEEELPQQLIESIVKFNIELLKDKIGPQWDKYNANWKDCDTIMQQIVLKTNLSKEFKWGSDIYTYKGKNCIGWRGFKEFFSLWFYNGVFLTDRYNVLINANEGNTKSLRQWRFSDVKEMDEQKILAYINESIQAILEGNVLKIEKNQDPLLIDGLLKESLSQNNNLKKAFEKLSRSKQKDYINYIKEAKQDKTKNSRLAKITPLILSGKGLNDHYKK